jgi:hypothetical protein
VSPMSPRAKRSMVVVALIGSIPILVPFGILMYAVLEPPAESYLRSVKFESTAWKAGTADHGIMWPTRLRMVDDLMRRRLLDGRTRETVERLLGSPDLTDKFRNWDMVYHLGPERGFFRIDSEWLVLRLDRSGKVVEGRIVRD